MSEPDFSYRLSYMIQHRIFQVLNDRREVVRFVEVGANDGVSWDPLHPFVRAHGWHGAFVEPVPYLFKRLTENYRGVPNLHFIQAACSRKVGTVPFYVVDESFEQISGLGPLLSSFDRATIERHEVHAPGLSQHIVETPVESLTLDAVIQRCGYDSVDLVAIDAEGVDDEVLFSLDLGRYRPAIVQVEHKHLTYFNTRVLDDYMLDRGYRYSRGSEDTLYLDEEMWSVREVRRLSEALSGLFTT